MSSTMARVSNITFTAAGIREPSSATTPSANAMSVAIGIPQPSAPSPLALNGEVDRRRHDHPAERRHGRQRNGSPIAQLPGDEFSLDLHPDDEEEHRHQQVVDHVIEVRLEDVGPDLDADVGRPERFVAGVPRRVRPDQRDDGGDEEQDAARRFDVQELDDGLHGTGRGAVALEEGGCRARDQGR